MIIPITKGVLITPVRQTIPYQSSLEIMYHILFQSDKGFFLIPLSQDFFIIPVRQKYSLVLSQQILFIIPVRQKIPYCSSLNKYCLLFQSGKRFLIFPLSKDLFTISARQRILYYSSLRGFLHYSNPTRDSLSFLSQRFSSLFQSGKRFFTIPLKVVLHGSNPAKDSLLFLS